MLKRMGPLDKILGMLPGMGGMKELAGQKPDEKQLSRIEAIINSMTPEERKFADILDGSRRKRVAKGSGTSVEDVNRLLKQFVEMQRMLKMVGQMTGEPIAEAPGKRAISPPCSDLSRRICRAISGSFHVGTPSRLTISRDPARRSSSTSPSAMRRKPNLSATSFTWWRNQGTLSASVPSRSKMARL